MRFKTIKIIDDEIDLKYELKKLGISMRQFAPKVKIHHTHLGRIANGYPTDENTVKIIKSKLEELCFTDEKFKKIIHQLKFDPEVMGHPFNKVDL